MLFVHPGLALAVVVSCPGNIQVQAVDQALHRDGFDPPLTQNMDSCSSSNNGNELTIEKLPVLPARIKRAGKPSGFRNAETQTLVSMTTMAGIACLSDFCPCSADFCLDLLGCVIAGASMDFFQQLLQRSPACQPALRFIDSQGLPMLVFIE
jgi:hypothetical protein